MTKRKTGMETVLGAQVEVLRKAFGPDVDIDEAVLQVEDYNLEEADLALAQSHDIHYAAGYIRGCAEIMDMTINEMVENFLPEGVQTAKEAIQELKDRDAARAANIKDILHKHKARRKKSL